MQSIIYLNLIEVLMYNAQGTITKFCIRNYYFIDWNENELNPCFKRLLINMSLDKKEEGKIKVFHPKLLP